MLKRASSPKHILNHSSGGKYFPIYMIFNKKAANKKFTLENLALSNALPIIRQEQAINQLKMQYFVF